MSRFLGKIKDRRWSRQDIIAIAGFFLGLTAVVAGISAIINHFFNPADNEVIRELLLHENVGFFVYFGYIVIASIIVPIPTLPFDLVMLGLVDVRAVIAIRVLGGLLGGSISFYLARRYGRGLIQRWLSPKNLEFIEESSDSLTWQEFFVITMFPIINAELMAYVGGLSKVKFRWILPILSVAIFYRLLFIFFIIRV